MFISSKRFKTLKSYLLGKIIKKNIVNVIYYIFIFVDIGFFFSGYILLKLPFGLNTKIQRNDATRIKFT